MTPETLERIKRRLFYLYEPHGAALFAVLDAARHERIHRALRRSTAEYDCLFSGHLEPALKAAAPYVVRLSPEGTLTDYFIEEGWGRSWGIFMAIQGGITTARRHLRTLLRVRTDTGKKLFFRYYDPRVLRIFLPTCDTDQLRQMFGPAYRFDMEADDPDWLVRFRRTSTSDNAALRSWTHALDGSTDVGARDE